MNHHLVTVASSSTTTLWTPWGPQTIAAKPGSKLESIRRVLKKAAADRKKPVRAEAKRD